MYKRYTLFMTAQSPFVWSHRLEFPVVGGLVGWGIAVLLGRSLPANGFGEFSAYEASVLLFFLIAASTVLVTITWLVAISRTMDLPHSLTASRYPIVTVVALGAVFLNAPPFAFANLALPGRPVYSLYGPYETGWPLMSTSGAPWDLVGLCVALSLVSIFVSFAVFAKKSGLTETILSLFACIGVIVGIAMVASLRSAAQLSTGVTLSVAAWLALIVTNVLFLKGVLFRGHVILSGTALFSCSFVLLWFFGMMVLVVFDRPSFSSDLVFVLWSAIAAFVASVVLADAVMAVVRRKRYRLL